MWLTVLTPANHWAEGFTDRPVEKYNTRYLGPLSSEPLKPCAIGHISHPLLRTAREFVVKNFRNDVVKILNP
jgi:hypothetical protein